MGTPNHGATIMSDTTEATATSRKSPHDTLANVGIEPLLPSSVVCVAEGNIARETLSRRVSRGEYPKPDRVLNGRNYWFASTVRRAQAGEV